MQIIMTIGLAATSLFFASMATELHAQKGSLGAMQLLMGIISLCSGLLAISEIAALWR